MITNAYDARNRLVSVTDRNSGDTLYTYDDNGNLTAVEDAEAKVTVYEYDARNLLTKTIYPDHEDGSEIGDLNYGIVECTYDAAQRKTAHLDQKGDVIEFKYAIIVGRNDVDKR